MVINVCIEIYRTHVTATLFQIRLQKIGNDFASRLNAIVSALREDDTPQNLYAKVTIVREGDHGLESRFFWHLIEDSASFSGGTFSYEDFMQFVNSGGQGGPPVVSLKCIASFRRCTTNSLRWFSFLPRDLGSSKCPDYGSSRRSTWYAAPTGTDARPTAASKSRANASDGSTQDEPRPAADESGPTSSTSYESGPTHASSTGSGKQNV